MQNKKNQRWPSFAKRSNFLPPIVPLLYYFMQQKHPSEDMEFVHFKMGLKEAESGVSKKKVISCR